MKHALGIDIGSTTVKVTVINESHDILFSDYKRHFANIKGTLQTLLSEAREKLGNLTIHPTVTVPVEWQSQNTYIFHSVRK